MIDLSKEPIFDPKAEDLAKETQRAVVQEGRDARRAGLPKDHVSGRFIDNDMTIDWQNGWRWEDEEITARKAKR